MFGIDNDQVLFQVWTGQEAVMFQAEHVREGLEIGEHISRPRYDDDQRLLIGADGLNDLFHSRTKDTKSKSLLQIFDLFEYDRECFVGQGIDGT